VRAISLWQPWASLIAVGAKRIETRSWATSYRGPLAIHAAKKWDREQKRIAVTEPFRSALARVHDIESLPGLDSVSLPLGKIVAVCRLVSCAAIRTDADIPGHPEALFGDYTPGRFAWHLTNVFRLDQPIPFTGAQGFFNVPDALLAEACRA
jgi:hypothetical protein